jgi:hypothetical protein
MSHCEALKLAIDQGSWSICGPDSWSEGRLQGATYWLSTAGQLIADPWLIHGGGVDRSGSAIAARLIAEARKTIYIV